jgi:hypothetical protein
MERLDLIPDDMVVSQVDLTQRENILITDKEQPRPNGYNNEQYVKWLNFQYIEACHEVIPYNYVITADGTIFYSKMDFISTRIDKFVGHENDILIFIEGNLKRLASAQEEMLAKLCALECIKYFLDASSIFYFPYDVLQDSSIAEYKNNLRQSLIRLLEQKNTIEIVKNSFARERNETGITVSKAQFVTPSTLLTLKELSELTGIPQNILLQQNQYLA